MNCYLYDGIDNYDYSSDVKNTFNVVKNSSRGDILTDFSRYSACYVFSNENLSSYYPNFKMDDGHVLTVCGSGDQVLMAILNGATSVDCFDTNRLSFYILMLKVYAIKYLDYDSFIYLFNISSRIHDRTKIFENLYKLCEQDVINNKLDSSQVDVMKIVMNFWLSFFRDISFDLSRSVSSVSYTSSGSDFFPYLFKKRDESIYESSQRISYLNKDEFLNLKSKIDNCYIRFINKSLEQVFDFYDFSYDFINLSNVFDYTSPSKFVDFIKSAKIGHLNNSGSIMANYSWSEPGSIDKINSVSAVIGAQQQLIPNINFEGKSSSGSIMVCHK